MPFQMDSNFDYIDMSYKILSVIIISYWDEYHDDCKLSYGLKLNLGNTDFNVCHFLEYKDGRIYFLK